MEVKKFYKGDVIFREGDPGDCMYDVYTGKVGIYARYKTPEETHLTDIYPDHYFGEMGLLDRAPRSATAVALEDDTNLGVVTEESFAEFFRKNPARVLMVLQTLSANLRRRTNDYIRVCRQIKELADKEGAKNG